MNAVSIKNMSKSIKSKIILNDFNLELELSQVYGLIGENGAGKTTLIRCIAGLLKPTMGSVQVFGEHSYNMSDNVKNDIAVVFDSPLFINGMDSMDNLRYFCVPYGVKKEDVERKFSVLSKELDLDVNNQKVGTFSWGMKQKLSIIRGLIIEPKLFILDEPFSGLDPGSKYTLTKVLNDYARNGDRIILISSHDLENIQEVAQKYIFIKAGELAAFGALDDLISDDEKNLVYRLTVSKGQIEDVLEKLKTLEHLSIIKVEDTVCTVRYAGSLFQSLAEMQLPLEEIQLVRRQLGDLFRKEV